jgi:hypothetical protein
VKEEVDPLSEAKSQVWFIETFARPLFELTASGIPGQPPNVVSSLPIIPDFVL